MTSFESTFRFGVSRLDLLQIMGLRLCGKFFTGRLNDLLLLGVMIVSWYTWSVYSCDVRCRRAIAAMEAFI